MLFAKHRFIIISERQVAGVEERVLRYIKDTALEGRKKELRKILDERKKSIAK